MLLTYVYHSCFALEDGDVTILFDYWRDSSEEGTGYVKNYLSRKKGKFYVLASHFHPDHFNSEILEWKRLYPDIVYILSKDILRHRRAPKDAAIYLAKGGVYADDDLRVEAFGSTDVGDSFLVTLHGKTIFHAGDLNNWHWQDESTKAEAELHEKHYLGELKDIAKRVKDIDVVMFPVDARIGSDYMRGARQFVERFRVGFFAPMHFSECGFASAAAFKSEAEAAGCRFWSIKKNGESISV